MSLSQIEELAVSEKSKFENLIWSADIIPDFSSKLNISDVPM